MNMVFIWYVYSLGFWYVMILLNPIRISQTISFPTLIDSVKNVRHPLLQHSFFLVSMTPEHNGSPPTFWVFLLRFLCGWFFSLPITEMLDIPKFCYGRLFFSLFLFFLVYCIHSHNLNHHPCGNNSEICTTSPALFSVYQTLICQWLVYISN